MSNESGSSVIFTSSGSRSIFEPIEENSSSASSVSEENSSSGSSSLETTITESAESTGYTQTIEYISGAVDEVTRFNNNYVSLSFCNLLLLGVIIGILLFMTFKDFFK